jgi:hypothetical protein
MKRIFTIMTAFYHQHHYFQQSQALKQQLMKDNDNTQM